MKKLLMTNCYRLDGRMPVSVLLRRFTGLLGIFYLLLGGPLQAQQPAAIAGNPVKGRILNEKGEPLAGASVRYKKDKKGTTTDANGAFSLPAQRGDVLVISYVGYAENQYVVGENKTFEVSMKPLPGNGNLNDVIVIGYGTQKKVNVTGAVSVIKAEDLVVTKNENVVNMMTGKVPGLRVQQLSSEPGSFNTQYDIRGLGNPLIVIDGVPRGSGDLSRMDPSEIESVSVLKDASAAIYGVKAANGVILVVTKHGARNANGKFNVNYSINQSWQQFLNVPEGVNAYQFMELTNEKYRRDFGTNSTATSAPVYSDSLMALYKNGTLKSTDWVKAITRPSAPETQHNLNVTGGNDKVNYFFDLGYFTQGSLFRTNSINYNRWNFRSNVNVNVAKNIRAQVLVSGYTDKKNQPGGRSVWEIFKYAENLFPTDPVYANYNPEYLHTEPDNANPVALINSDLVGKSNYQNKNFQGQLGLEYDLPFVSGLTARVMYNYGLGIADNNTVRKAFNLYDYNATNDTYKATLVNSPSTVNRQYYTNTNTLMQLSLNYKRQFGGVHNVGALLLYEESHSTGDDFSSQRQFSLGIPYLFAGDDVNQVASMDGNGLYEYVTKSLVGRFTYDYKGKYLAEFTFRQDGSSRFSPTARWGFFPAVLAGWRISNEPFLQNLVSPKILSNLKVRASYGKTGDDAPVQYQWVSGYNYPGTGAILGGNYVNGLTSRGVTNDALTWLKSKAFNVGVDFDLFNGLLGGSVDYFTRTRDGLLATKGAQLPGTVGVALPQENLNGDQTQGIEILLTHRRTVHQVTYNISGNISVSRTQNRYHEETRAGSSYDSYKGALTDRYTNIWWDYVYGGQFGSYSQIYGYGVNTGGGNQSAVPGDYYYQDLNHDGVIDAKDQVPIATRDIPIVNFGLTLGANWQQFDLSVLLQGATDFHVQYAEQLNEPLMFGRSALTQFLDRWRPADPNANEFDPNTKWLPGNYPNTGSPVAVGTRAVQNATYMRIKSLEIGYTLPRKILNIAGFQNLRIYANSYNLATLTGLKNSDPEHPGVVGPNQDWNISQGGYLYPMNRTFSVGASVSF